MALATLLGGAVRFAYVLWLPGQNGDLLFSDMLAYDWTGQRLAHGESIAGGMGFNGLHSLSASTYYHVGYTWFVGLIYLLVGDDNARPALRIAQALISTATIPLTYAVGRRVFGGRAGVIAAYLTAIYLPLVYYAGLLLTETLCIFLQMLALWLWIDALDRKRLTSAVAAGMMAGLACTVRTAFVPAISAWALAGAIASLRNRDNAAFRLSLALVVAAVATIAPVTLRNYQVHGKFILLSTNGPATFYTGHVSHTVTIADLNPNESDAVQAAQLRQRNLSYLRDHWRQYLAEIPEFYQQIWLTSDFWPATTTHWASMPIDREKRLGRVRLTSSEPGGPPFGRIDYFPDAMRYNDGLLWLLLGLPGALLAPWFAPRADRRWHFVAWTLAPYLIIPWIAPPFPRYRVPASPLIFLLAGATIAQLSRIIAARRGGRSTGDGLLTVK